MFATLRKPAMLAVGTVLSAGLFAAGTWAQTPSRISQASGMRNTFAPNRPNISSMRSATNRGSLVPVAGAPMAPAASAPSGGQSSDGGSQGGGSQGGGSQGGGSESQPAQGGGLPEVRYVSPYDLPEGSKRETSLAALRAYGGGLNWPIGVRTLGPEEKMKELREQIDSVVEAVLRQPATEPASAELVQAAAQRLKYLSERFNRLAYDLPLSRAQEKDARQFLRNAYVALKALEPAPTQATLETKK
jgi:hypothetical protein